MESILLEVCVDSILSLKEAIKGGADRIELCSSLNEGGLTPSYGFIEKAKEISPIPIFVLVRPRAGNFFYSEEEFDIIIKDIENAKELGADGIVTGFLDSKSCIATDQTSKAVETSYPLPFTFHRAFDVSSDNNINAIELLKKSGVNRLLTSGKKPTAHEGIETIKELVSLSRGDLEILAGSGVNPTNALDIIGQTGVKEIHASCKTTIKNNIQNNNTIAMGQNDPTDSLTFADSNKVKNLKEIISY